MLAWDNEKNFLVYPSWANFSYAWPALPELFKDPLSTVYAESRTRDRWVELGYRMKDDDYKFHDGPFGGGVIEKQGSSKFWSPLIILGSEAELRKPFRMSLQDEWWVTVLVPKILAEHKLGIERMPPAPAPRFSIEPINSLQEHSYLILGCSPRKRRTFKVDGFVAALRQLGINCAVYVGDSPIPQENLSVICPLGLDYHWIQIKPERWSANALFAFVVYVGAYFAKATPGSLFRVHLASAFRDFPQRYGSCRTWPVKLATAKTSQDW